MVYSLNGKKLIYNFSEYLIAFMLILNCRSMWTSLISTRDIFVKSSVLALVCATIICILTVDIINFSRLKKGIIRVSCFVFYMLVYVLLNTYNRKELLLNIAVVCVLIIWYYICNLRNSRPSILFKYEKIIIVIAIVSVFFWFFGSQFNLIKPSDIVYSNWSGTGLDKTVSSYYGIYFETQVINFEWFGQITRNSAIFVESPMCSLHFSIALLIELFIKEKSSKSRSIILILANLTTLSSTGLILIVLSLGIKFIINNPKSKIFYLIKILIIPLCIVSICAISYILLRGKMGTDSGSIRLDDFSVGFKAWKENILLGSGFNNYDFIKSFMENWRSYNIGFSNSPMIVLSDGGIYMGLLYIFTFGYGIMKSLKMKEKNKCAFILMIVYLFITTIFPYQYLLYYMLIYLFDSDSYTINILSNDRIHGLYNVSNKNI